MQLSVFLFLVASLVTSALAVRHGRRSAGEMVKKLKLAFEHGVRLQIEGNCKDPKPQVTYINSTDPSKVYIPRGTIVHRCSDQTGCCPDASHSCQAIDKVDVSLYFLTYTLKTSGRHHGRKQPRQEFEQITFSNHTACACRPISSFNEDSVDLDSDELNGDQDVNEV